MEENEVPLVRNCYLKNYLITCLIRQHPSASLAKVHSGFPEIGDWRKRQLSCKFPLRRKECTYLHFDLKFRNIFLSFAFVNLKLFNPHTY